MVSLRRLDWVLMGAVAAAGRARPRCWSGRPPRTASTSPAATRRPTCASSWSTSRSGSCCSLGVTLVDHRWVRILAPLVYLVSVAGLVLVLIMGSTINGSRSWLLRRRAVDPALGARQAGRGHRHGAGAGRAGLDPLAPPGRHGRGAADAGHRGRARRADPAAARPRHDAGALGHGVRRPRGLRRAPPLAGAGPARCRRGRGRRAGAAACSRPTRWTASWPSSTPTSTRAAPATTSSRPASPSATAACSVRGSSTARRPARASSPSSRPTSSSPSRARSSAWWAPGSSSRCSAW